jgi:hypothetical protein
MSHNIIPIWAAAVTFSQHQTKHPLRRLVHGSQAAKPDARLIAVPSHAVHPLLLAVRAGNMSFPCSLHRTDLPCGHALMPALAA